MRRTAFFIYILAAALQAVAQSYLPILKDGTEWLCYSSNGVVQTYYYFHLDGDTIVDGNTGYRLFLRYVQKQTDRTYDIHTANGALFEKDGRVYAAYNKNRRLMCDMSMKVGDTTPDGQWRVAAVDNIYVTGRTLRRLTLEATGQPQTIYWIEGVGSSTGIDARSTAQLVTCNEDGKCIFAGVQLTGMPEVRTEPDADSRLLEEGREWWYRDETGQWYGLPIEFRLFVQGDTIAAGQTWKKLYHDHTPGAVPEYAKALREDNGRVYELTADGGSRLLFDFTAGTGDRYNPDGAEDSYQEVVATDTMVSAGHAHHRIILQKHANGLATRVSCWVKGVGSDYGIDADADWSRQDWERRSMVSTFDDVSLYQFIGCLSASGQLLYGTSPTPQTDAVAFPSHSVAHPATLYDLQGRRLTGKPQHGLYIKNGKKVQAK